MIRFNCKKCKALGYGTCVRANCSCDDILYTYRPNTNTEIQALNRRLYLQVLKMYLDDKNLTKPLTR